MKKWYTYLAFHNNNTFKVGYSFRVFERVTRDLTASSGCFFCVRREHHTKVEAKQAENTLKTVLRPYQIADASCKEWHHSKKRGVKTAIFRALHQLQDRSKLTWTFEIAEGLAVKSSTTWEAKPLEKIKKIIKKST